MLSTSMLLVLLVSTVNCEEDNSKSTWQGFKDALCDLWESVSGLWSDFMEQLHKQMSKFANAFSKYADETVDDLRKKMREWMDENNVSPSERIEMEKYMESMDFEKEFEKEQKK